MLFLGFGKRVRATFWCALEKKVHAAVPQVCDTRGRNLKYIVAFSYGCSLGCQEGLTSASTAGKDDIVDKESEEGCLRSRA